MRKVKKRNRVMSEINIVPLTDMMMVLLVIFMVTTPLIMKANIDINLPKAHVKQESETVHVQITLTKQGKLFLDGQEIEIAQLKPSLETILQASNDPSVTISADREVIYGQAVQLLDIARQAGAKKLVIAADPLPVKPLSEELINN